ncbi:MAG: peptidase M75 [Bacteroidales bacterium]|nr:peptidase M75 [Bacteroidales bacterium]
MKRTTIKMSMIALLAVATIGFTACKRETDTTVEDTAAQAVNEQFVNHTVVPTYTALASKAELLADQLAALKQNPTDAGVRQACATFLEAREQWEMSEAFLFGAAGDFGIDPHIDSWPLDENAFSTLMNSPAMIEALDDEEGDVVAGERLGNALLGFHAIEYILFANGQPKAAASISANEWIYAVAVAGDLRNRCYQLEVGWMGENAPASHIKKLDDLELAYTVAGSDNSYGDNMKNAGKAGSTYSSRLAALMAMVQGCIDIADEVGTSKIASAFRQSDITYIESPYSHMSITDFHNNIISIRNVYMGGIEGQRNESYSLHNFVKERDAALDAEVIDAIQNALNKIDAMPAPFVLHYSEPANGVAVEACTELSEELDKVTDLIKRYE